MTQYIVIGCPYTSMRHLDLALHHLGAEGIDVINCDDVVAIDHHFLCVGRDARRIPMADIAASFVRYPYDLIPPHSRSFQTREPIEYYKTLALAVDTVSLNRLSSTWILRNRLYSLRAAESHGINVPACHLITDGGMLQPDDVHVLKALGNCFVSETMENIDPALLTYCTIEKDGEDVACILPASTLHKSDVDRYLSCVGAAFLQQPVLSQRELRGYVIGEHVFLYERAKTDTFDKSAAAYQSTDIVLSRSTLGGLRSLMRDHGLAYLCVDIIVDCEGDEHLIDLNPYGSMPSYDEFPETSDCLATLLLERAKVMGLAQKL